MRKYLIIGSGPASINCAVTIKRLDAHSYVKVLTKDKVLFHKMVLPSILRRGFEVEDLLIAPPENIEFEYGEEICGFDAERRVVYSKNREWTYDKLFLGLGSIPRRIELENAIYISELDGVIELKKRLETGAVKNIVILGFGMVAVELVDIFNDYGIRPVIVSASAYPLSGLLPPIIGEKLRDFLRPFAEMYFSDDVKKYENGELILKSGTRLNCDLLIVTKGWVSNPSFSSFEVNDHFMTQFEDVYAGGDLVKVKNVITGERESIMLHSVAWRSGFYAGLNMTGVEVEFPGVIFYSVTKSKRLRIMVAGNLKNFDNIEISNGGNSLLCKVYSGDKPIGIFSVNRNVNIRLREDWLEVEEY